MADSNSEGNVLRQQRTIERGARTIEKQTSILLLCKQHISNVLICKQKTSNVNNLEVHCSLMQTTWKRVARGNDVVTSLW